jgi:hypothetical protein
MFRLQEELSGSYMAGLTLRKNKHVIRACIFDDDTEAYKTSNNENRTIKQNIKARISRTLVRKWDSEAADTLKLSYTY